MKQMMVGLQHQEKTDIKGNFIFIITDIWHTDQNLFQTHFTKVHQKDVSLPVAQPLYYMTARRSLLNM